MSGTATRLKRFKVIYKGKQHFSNSATSAGAITMVWAKLLSDQKAEVQVGTRPAIDEQLASYHSFRQAIGIAESLRY